VRQGRHDGEGAVGLGVPPEGRRLVQRPVLVVDRRFFDRRFFDRRFFDRRFFARVFVDRRFFDRLFFDRLVGVFWQRVDQRRELRNDIRQLVDLIAAAT
jgi:hypothetical protein